MIEILCFGDSNTYGFTPDWKHRYGRDIRYPGVLQALLGDGYTSRRTAWSAARRRFRTTIVRAAPRSRRCR